MTECCVIFLSYARIIKDYLLSVTLFLFSSTFFYLLCLLPLDSPFLSLFLSVACNDLAASGRDRKPNAFVQVAVIDPQRQQLVFHACTEIVEVRRSL